MWRLEGGKPVILLRTLVRKSKSEFEYADGVYDLSWASGKQGFALGSTLNFLFQGTGGGMTALPLGIEPYLTEYAADRKAVREALVVDPKTKEARKLPGLDYKIVHKLAHREHVEGWFGQAKMKRLMLIIYILAGCLVAAIIVGGVVGANPHIIQNCFDTHGSTNFTQWSPEICPSLQKVTQSISTTTLPNGNVVVG